MSIDNINLKLKNHYLREEIIEIREYQVQIALNCYITCSHETFIKLS